MAGWYGLDVSFLLRAAGVLGPGGGEGMTFEANLPSSQAFDARADGAPGVIVHAPPGFTAPGGRANVVVYFHGHNGCARAVVADAATHCTPSGPARTPSRLVSQMDASRVNALLVVPQLKFEAASGDAGRLGREGGLAAFLRDVLAAYAERAGSGPLSLGRVAVFAHSGGYVAAAAAVSRGGVPSIDRAVLLDALYGNSAQFEAFARATGHSLRVLYTRGGGTYDNALALQARLGARASFELVSDAHSSIPGRRFGAELLKLGFPRV